MIFRNGTIEIRNMHIMEFKFYSFFQSLDKSSLDLVLFEVALNFVTPDNHCALHFAVPNNQIALCFLLYL